MNKTNNSLLNTKYIIILIILLILIIITTAYFFITLLKYIDIKKSNAYKTGTTNTSTLTSNEISTEFSDDNSSIITVDDNSSIRIINSYDKEMFTGKKSIIFFWASWCYHCDEEIELIKDVTTNLSNKNYNIFLISHDYDIDDLSTFMKNNNINCEVLFDEKRIIRKNLNPMADSVPLTYFLDEKGELMYSHDSTIDLDTLNSLISTYISN